MLLSIIIINYKTPELTLRCIESIMNEKDVGFEIIVVDNDSQDNSKKLILLAFPSVVWVQNSYNAGFGRANNLGVQKSKGDYLLFLNSDMIIPEETINKCLEKIKSGEKIGVLGCKLLNDDGSPQKSTYSVASYRKLLDNNLIINKILPMGEEPAEAIMGSFMMMSKKIFEQAGGFDPDFFMYSEELDLCHRIRKNGYKIFYFDEASAIHKHGGSINNKSWGYNQRALSNSLLHYKVKGFLGYLLYHILFIFNTITNFFAMWLLDKTWRKSYWKEQRYYFSNFAYYFSIPFLYGRKPGSGKRMLKAR